METRVRGVLISYAEHGDGIPLVALHGAGVDHRDIEAALEADVPAAGYRRIYPDLPGMGGSTAEGLSSNSDVVALLADFIDQISDGPVLLAGHSYGAYLARGVAAVRPDLLLGLALLCPFGDGSRNLPEHRAVQQDADAYEDLEPEHRDGFDGYFVVRTRAMARRYRDHVAPGTALVDQTALERIFAKWGIEIGMEPFNAPTLIVAGRQDATAGYVHATALMEMYPRATLAVINGAGHALMHERPLVLGALIDEWLNRASRRDV